MNNLMLTPTAIEKITGPEKIRVLLYMNNTFVHVSLSAILAPLEARIKTLEEKLQKTGV